MGNPQMNITVTGSHGYLGSILVPMLLAEGHHVTALDNMSFGQQTLAEHVGNPHFEPHKVDVRNIHAVRPFLPSADVVIPLAGLVGAPICNMNPVDAELLNVTATRELIDALRPEQLIIFPSTESVYGRQSVLCDENTPAAPLVSYGHQKLAIEKHLAGRPNSISFRMATLFGMSPRHRIDLLINDFVWRAMKDRALVVFEAHAMRTCLHVVDAARAFVHCLNMRPLRHEIYNIGSIVVSKLGLCEAIKKQVPEFFYVEAQYATDPDARNYVVSDAKIRATGFAPTMTLDAAIAELLRGYRMLNNSRHSNV